MAGLIDDSDFPNVPAFIAGVRWANAMTAILVLDTAEINAFWLGRIPRAVFRDRPLQRKRLVGSALAADENGYTWFKR